MADHEDYEMTAEIQTERKIDWIVRELDELCALANNPGTRDLVIAQAVGIGQIQFRSALILDFLQEPPKLKMVSNNG